MEPGIIISLKRGAGEDISQHFHQDEFDCKCSNKSCKITLISLNLIYVLEVLRWRYRNPIPINSGYRCPLHNTQIQGAANSQHMVGRAADIPFNNEGIRHALKGILGPNGGIGSYNNFTHIDVREGIMTRWDETSV